MSAKRLLVAGVLIGIAQIVGHAQRGNSNSGIIGVWRVSEIAFIEENKRTVTKPQPGIIIFTPRYYSRNLVTSDEQRAELPPPDKRTDKQIADAFGPSSQMQARMKSGATNSRPGALLRKTQPRCELEIS